MRNRVLPQKGNQSKNEAYASISETMILDGMSASSIIIYEQTVAANYVLDPKSEYTGKSSAYD